MTRAIITLLTVLCLASTAAAEVVRIEVRYVSEAALRLIDDGYLLAEDLAPILGRAGEHWNYLMEAGTP